MHDKTASRTRAASPTSVTPDPVQRRDSELKRSLRGASFEEGAGMLAPPAEAAVQMRGGADKGAKDVQARAAEGVAGTGGALPHLDAIQRSFGQHDVSQVQAHQGSEAQRAAQDIGAEAYASGNHVAFGGSPDLFTAAHEAAHIVQQRAGVQLEGGVGAVGDRYEQQADAVAHAVVRGESAEGLLGAGGGAAAGGAVQMARKKKNTTKKNTRNRRGGGGGKKKGGGGGKGGGPTSGAKKPPSTTETPSETTTETTPTEKTTETTPTETTTETTPTENTTETTSETTTDATPTETTTDTTPTENTTEVTETPTETTPTEAPTEEAPKPVVDREGKSAWNGEVKRLIDMIPTKLTDHKTVLGRGKWRDRLEKTVFADDIASFTEAGWAKDTVTQDITTNAGARASTWMDYVWKTVADLKGRNVPTKGQLWSFLGWQIKGQEWDMKHVAAGPTGTRLHITASGNSIPAPSTLVGTDPEILEKDPALIYQSFFESVDVVSRVHVTRESQPKKHLFIGGVNGLGMAIGDSDWGGDAATMKTHLANFKSNVIAKLTEAKLLGWKLP